MRDAERPLRISAILLLIIAILIVYWPVQHYDFVNYDDEGYVTNNLYVHSGLTREGLIWAFTNFDIGHWHPLTWLSHMVDYRLFSRNPAGHHWTNVLIHLLNALLLLGILERMTGMFWRSFLVAALFAVHPLNVESVAWISERKNVLSTLFWVLTLWVYWWYALAPRFSRYALLTVTFLLGLLTKPMLVTLPFVLLLVDFWPLRRLGWGWTRGHVAPASERIAVMPEATGRRIIAEKIPLLILVFFSITQTIRAAAFVDTLATTDAVPFSHRLITAVVSYAAYIEKIFWPSGLAVFYPYPQNWSFWEVGGAVLLLTGVSGFVVLFAKRLPYLPMGWLWYLGTLVPVIGLVQAGGQAMADRYGYVPLIGLFIMIVWAVSDWARSRRLSNRWLPVLSILILTALSAIAMKQLPYWRNSTALFEHALEVTRNNHVAHSNLGEALMSSGRPKEAIAHFEAALKIKTNPDYYNNVGIALAAMGRTQEAMIYYQKALKGNPGYAKAYNNIGVALGDQQRYAEAMAYFKRALELKPDYADAHNNRGLALALQGKPGEALFHYEKALGINPETPGTNRNLGMALMALGKWDEAIVQFRTALSLHPEDSETTRLLECAVFKRKTGVTTGTVNR
jgi:protein O-mannosyl-transferase